MPRHLLRLATLFSALLLGFVMARGAAADPILFASWKAPYGEPRATDSVGAGCDNQGADTLYLSFDPGEKVPAFFGVTASVGFFAASGDTLSLRWLFGGGEGNLYNVRVYAGPDSSLGTHQPWGGPSLGGVRYNHTSSRGYLAMVYAQAPKDSTQLEKGQRYCFARLIIPHPPASAPGCDQPVCIELASVRIANTLYGSTELLGTRGSARWVSLGEGGKAVCDHLRDSQGPVPWTPWKK